MSFLPVVPAGGIVGWTFLQRTRPAQEAVLFAAPAFQRDTAYFAERIGSVRTAEDLVSDRRLLSVALGAFGLNDDLDNRFFIRKVLEDGTLRPDALANRLSDERYGNLAKAFGFGDFSTPRTALSTFPEEILSTYRAQSFERAVGETNDNLRLALNMQRALGELAEGSSSETTKWFKIMGNPPLRSVFETALGLPGTIGRLDIDQQLEMFRDKAGRVFGDDGVSQFAGEEAREKLARLFLLRADTAASTFGFSSARTALSLLSA